MGYVRYGKSGLRVSELCLGTMTFGKEADEAEQLAYLEWLASVREKIRGVHLYGVARPSLQAAAPRLSRLPVECFERFAGRITALGIPVLVNP